MIKRIVYFILVFFTAYGAVIYNSASMVFLTGVGVLLPLFLSVILIIQSIRLKLSFSETPHFVEGKVNTQTLLTVWNRSGLPIRRLEVRLEFKNLTTGAQKKLWIREPIDTNVNELPFPNMELEYGIWHITCKKILLFDFLHLCSIRKWKQISCQLVKLPAKYQTNIKITTSDSDSVWESQEYEQNKSGGDTSYTREIRDYRPGDKLQNIHWKLSAKKDQLLVKEYGQPRGCSLLLGISINGLTEESMELIYSLMEACVDQHCNFLLIWRGGGGQKRQPAGHSQDGEVQINRFPVMHREAVYLAMEAIMREQVSVWGQEPRPQLPGKQLWLEQPMKLTIHGTVIQDLSEGNLKERLADMELII